MGNRNRESQRCTSKIFENSVYQTAPAVVHTRARELGPKGVTDCCHLIQQVGVENSDMLADARRNGGLREDLMNARIQTHRIAPHRFEETMEDNCANVERRGSLEGRFSRSGHIDEIQIDFDDSNHRQSLSRG